MMPAIDSREIGYGSTHLILVILSEKGQYERGAIKRAASAEIYAFGLNVPRHQ
jgi:hypothetical protein